MPGGGWITAKKRGRDDALIAKDRKRALQQRKKSVKRPKKKSKHEDDEVDDDDQSMDNFIVNSDEEVSEAAASDEEDLDTFLGMSNAKKRVSKLPPHMERQGRIRTNAQKERSFKSKPANRQLQQRKSAPSSTTYSSSDSELEVVGVSATKSRFFPQQGDSLSRALPAKKPAASTINLQSSDDDDSVLQTPGKKKKGNASRKPITDVKAWGTTTATLSSVRTPEQRMAQPTSRVTEDTDDESVGNLGRIAKTSGFVDLGLFSDDNDGSPMPKSRLRKISHEKKRTSVKKVKVIDMMDGGHTDEDEDMAVAMAIRNSLKDQETSPHVLKQPVKSKVQPATKQPKVEAQSDQEDRPDALLEESSSEDDGGDDAQEDYADPAAREASTILEQANSLSSQILDTLSSWSSGTTDNMATKGLIANGALTLTGLGANNGGSKSGHRWISHETMAKICPSVKLAEYQLIGVNWMALLHGMKCKVQGSKSHTNVNGIMADEMGLGKTVQTITFLSYINSDFASKASPSDRLPHLVVAPVSVLSNWEREFEKFAPHLHVVRFHGSKAERDELRNQLRNYLPGHPRSSDGKPLDVILAPITSFQKEKSDDRSFLRKFRYEYMVVDEAHLLKNARGTRYKSLDKFHTNHRLLLTGTPVQNSPKELLSLLCFLMPLFSRRSLPSYDEESQNDGGESMLEHFVSIKNGGSDESDAAAYDKLKQLFAPFVLRRRKADVLSQVMPPKTQKVELVDLDPRARTVYDSLLEDHIRSKRQGGETSKDHLFTQLRKAAHHPLLLRTRYRTQAERDHLAEYFHKYGAFQGEACTRERVAGELEGFNDFQIHLTALELIDVNPHRRANLDRYVLNEDALFSSTKFSKLRTLLPDLIADGHRILIFSGWTSCLDLLSCLLESLDLQHLRMEGSTPVSERQSLIDQFNRETSIPIFLLSTRACGLGINLTSADTCIFHDLDFNPMNDAQAEDRCHRIGQKKPVTVIRMVSKNTVDEDIYEMQQRKAKMSQVIMATNGETWSSKEAAREKKEVLKNALDRFMHSPSKKPGKENSRAVVNFDRDEL